MKDLKDYKEEIHRCSKCGLCQAVCPIYQETGNECSVSRGQFIMLGGVIKDKLKINKNINKYLDLCLKCNKCKNFCPSEIDVIDILLSAKSQYFKKSLSGKVYSFFESKPVFNTFLKIVDFVSSIFCKKIKSEKFEKKAIYFGGCISKIHPNIDNYVIKLLNSMKIEVVPINFNCCGMPFLTTGNLDRFEEQAIENIKKLPQDFDYFITDCASCQWAWKQYIKYINNENLKNKLNNINFKSIYELILENNVQFRAKKEEFVTYHKPCHENIDIEKILNSCENIKYEQLNGYDECCGFAGFEHPQTLKTISKILLKKRKNILNSKSKNVLTTCVGCLSSLRILTLFTNKKVNRLLAFLKDKCDIK